MYTITAVLPSPSDERVLLRLACDGGEEKTLSVRVSELSRHGLKKGAALSSELFDRLRDRETLDAAVRRGLSILGYGTNSVARLEEKLRNHGYPQEISAKAVTELVKMGYIDERSDVLRLCDSMISKKYGPRKILISLRSRGYKGDALRAADEFLSETDFSAVCESFLLAKVKKSPENPAEMKKLLAKLVSLGYNVNEAKTAISRFMAKK